MVADEDPFEAARRGTLEEIGSAFPGGDENLEVVNGEFEIVREKPLTRAPTQWEETMESPSYPGLSTVYTIYQVEAFVMGLSPMEFTTREMGKDKMMLKVTHVWVWHPTIERLGELPLNQVQEALLQRLYRGSQRLEVELLHGSNSGSLVLKVRSWDMGGTRFNEPTIVKLDHAETLKREVQQNQAMLEHIQTNAIAIVRPAEYTSQWGGFVLEVAADRKGAVDFAVRTEMEAKLHRAMMEAAEATSAREVAVQKVAKMEATMEILNAEMVLAARRATEAAAADTAKKAEELKSLLWSLSAFQAQVMQYQYQARQHSADAAQAEGVSVLEPRLHFRTHPHSHPDPNSNQVPFGDHQRRGSSGQSVEVQLPDGLDLKRAQVALRAALYRPQQARR